jgi:hypothetical protein
LLSTLCTQSPPFYVFRSRAIGAHTRMKPSKLRQDEMIGVRARTELYDNAKKLLEDR